jgi:hypothetical protein
VAPKPNPQNHRAHRAPTAPFPRTRRWLRRILRLTLLASIICIAAHAYWAHYTKRALDDQIRTYAAAGEPIFPTDLNDPPIPDQENAVVNLRAALALLKPNSEEWNTFRQIELRLPLSRNLTRILATVLDHNWDALGHIDAATAKPAANWNIRFSSPLLTVQTENLPGLLHAAVLLRAAAFYAHHEGDDLSALRRIDQMLALARITDRQGLPAAHDVALALDALAASAACDLAPYLSLPTPAFPTARKLIDHFLDDRPITDGQLRALHTTRAILCDTAKAVSTGRAELLLDIHRLQGPLPSRLGCYAAKPLMMTDALWMIRYTSAMTDAARRATDFPAFCRAAPPDPAIVLAHQPRGHFLAIALIPDFTRFIGAQYRATTQCRIAAVALAAGLYAADHQGIFPTAADQLVPQYLPYIPFDPMAQSGQPLHLKSASDGTTRIYSVGQDGIDDGGSTVPTNPSSASSDRWTQRDLVITLKRLPPATKEKN